MSSDAKTPVAELSFEQALKELESVVGALEKGSVALDESIALYERGAALRTHCETKLKEAEAKVTQITEGPDGAISGQDVEIT